MYDGLGNLDNDGRGITVDDSGNVYYTSPSDYHVTLTIYNILGRKISTPVDAHHKAGYKTVRWDARSLSSGIYFYRLQAGDFVQTRKMVLIR